MILKLFWFMALAAANAADLDSQQRSILFGHNLTPTTYTLPARTVSVGVYAIAAALTDRVTVATSPWLLKTYNSYNAVVRTNGCFHHNDQGCEVQWGSQLMYVKSSEQLGRSYQMEVAGGSFVTRFGGASFYNVNFALNYMYFFDETAPFSLRREPYSRDAYQFSPSILQEIRLPYNLGLLIETGVLGANYVYPEMHIGLSMHYKTDHWLVQVGFSQTFTTGALSRMFTVEQTKSIVRGEPGYDFSMHPEVQLQFFL